MSQVHRSLTLMVYGESKVGKSTFAVTAPYPRLMLDVEGGHRFLLSTSSIGTQCGKSHQPQTERGTL
jgi:hypothetical protein